MIYLTEALNCPLSAALTVSARALEARQPTVARGGGPDWKRNEGANVEPRQGGGPDWKRQGGPDWKRQGGPDWKRQGGPDWKRSEETIAVKPRGGRDADWKRGVTIDGVM